MNTHIDVEERLEMDATLQMAGSEIDMLVRCGFSREEIAALRLSAAVVPDRWQRSRCDRASPGVSEAPRTTWKVSSVGREDRRPIPCMREGVDCLDRRTEERT